MRTPTTWSRTLRTSRRAAGFTSRVLDGDDDVIGGVYIYPDDDQAHDAHVRSRVRADRGELDVVVRTTVAEWLHAVWPFAAVRYEGVQS
jgi:hypothetical protein